MGILKLTIQGKGDITLSEEQDFLGKGGEGIVYEKSGIVYKIFHDRKHMTPPAKIRELQVLDHPSIIRPLDVILDTLGREIGFTMTFVHGEVLCKLFNTTYLLTHNIQYQVLLDLVENIRKATSFVHSKDCLIVDGNEMNYLVKFSDFSFPYFIDTGCYQTPNFPALAISTMYKDPHNNTFSELTDWYSFAILICKILVGVHPYKGTHPSYLRKETQKRMVDNVSIFDTQVSLPSSSRSIHLIPKVCRSWLEDVLQDGERSAPPSLYGVSSVGAPYVSVVKGTNAVSVKKIREYSETILRHVYALGSRVIVLENSVYVGAQEHVPSHRPFRGNVVLSEKTLEPIFCWIDRPQTSLDIQKLYIEYRGIVMETILEAYDGFVYENTLYILSKSGKFIEVVFSELSRRILASAGNVYEVLPKSSKIFRNTLYQSVIGKAYFGMPSRDKTVGNYFSVQSVSELDDYRIVSASYNRNVLMTIGEYRGRFDKFIFRCSHDFSSYDVKKEEDYGDTSINMSVLRNGIIVDISPDGDINLFANTIGSSKEKRIENQSLPSGFVTSEDSIVLFVSDKTIYKLTMT